MNQLAIYCSRDIEDRVVRALDAAGVGGFLHVAHATGNKFKPGDELPRLLTWDAVLSLVPAVAEDRVDTIMRQLADYAGSCEVDPCLRMVVSAVEKVL